jgi:hypothetical protein
MIFFELAPGESIFAFGVNTTQEGLVSVMVIRSLFTEDCFIVPKLRSLLYQDTQQCIF